MNKIKEFLIHLMCKLINLLNPLDEVGSFVFINDIKYYVSDSSKEPYMLNRVGGKMKITLESEESIKTRMGVEDIFDVRECKRLLNHSIREFNKVKSEYEEYKSSEIYESQEQEFISKCMTYKRSMRSYKHDIKELKRLLRYYNIKKNMGVGLYPAKILNILLWILIGVCSNMVLLPAIFAGLLHVAINGVDRIIENNVG